MRKDSAADRERRPAALERESEVAELESGIRHRSESSSIRYRCLRRRRPRSSVPPPMTIRPRAAGSGTAVNELGTSALPARELAESGLDAPRPRFESIVV